MENPFVNRVIVYNRLLIKRKLGCFVLVAVVAVVIVAVVESLCSCCCGKSLPLSHSVCVDVIVVVKYIMAIVFIYWEGKFFHKRIEMLRFFYLENIDCFLFVFQKKILFVTIIIIIIIVILLLLLLLYCFLFVIIFIIPCWRKRKGFSSSWSLLGFCFCFWFKDNIYINFK